MEHLRTLNSVWDKRSDFGVLRAGPLESVLLKDVAVHRNRLSIFHSQALMAFLHSMKCCLSDKSKNLRASDLQNCVAKQVFLQ